MSNKNFLRKFLPFFVSIALITAAALTATGCQEKSSSNEEQSSAAEISQSSVSDESTAKQQQVSFTFKVVDSEGKETSFDISTAEKTVGAALLKEGLIEGESSEYGLYVKTVNGITADFDTTGTYWAFYIGDQYASTGVDSTDITEGETYSFRIEKG